MSSPSERLQRGGAVALFALAMAVSAVLYFGATPLFGAPPVPAAVARAVDSDTAILSQAKRPFEQVIFCEPLKAYVPNLVALSQGGVRMGEAAPHPVILCTRTAPDLKTALARARADGLGWVRRIAGSDMVVLARDEAGFRSAMAQAGVDAGPLRFAPFAPQLHSLRSNAPGAVEDEDGWRIPAHADEGLVLFGPYADLGPGPYRLSFQAKLVGTPDQCRAAAAAYHPSIAVTRDGGQSLQAKAPAMVVVDRADPCRLGLEAAFTAPAGGAKLVETPLSGATSLPMIVDDYALEPAASAQSR